jgi:hypothetical protein
MAVMENSTLELLLEHKDALEAEWPGRMAALRASGAILNAGDGEGEGEGDEGEGEGEGEGGADDEPTIEDVQAELAESRKEQAKLKRQLAAAKGATTKAAKKTPKKDDEPDTAAAEELAAEKERSEKLERQLRDIQAEGIARDLKFVDASDAVRLLDWDEIADATDRKEVRDALKRLKKDKPHLAATAEGGGTGAGKGRSGAGAGVTMNDLIRQSVTRGR